MVPLLRMKKAAYAAKEKAPAGWLTHLVRLRRYAWSSGFHGFIVLALILVLFCFFGADNEISAAYLYVLNDNDFLVIWDDSHYQIFT